MRLVLEIFGIIYILLSVIGVCTILYFERKDWRKSLKENKKQLFKNIIKIPIFLLFSPIMCYFVVIKHDYL